MRCPNNSPLSGQRMKEHFGYFECSTCGLVIKKEKWGKLLKDYIRENPDVVLGESLGIGLILFVLFMVLKK